ncbi:hypothetical protein B0H15DRAFT_803451 [Mycena belliarum]|uniref:Uncharacterized protein n=1 Tax=Mycena belliarum TaxID=1033014 RepID=A0AAD6TWT4_9AGAR|nr:hypothetical protein B0H15DRAFT_803451 [Mycena belliae]
MTIVPTDEDIFDWLQDLDSVTLRQSQLRMTIIQGLEKQDGLSLILNFCPGSEVSLAGTLYESAADTLSWYYEVYTIGNDSATGRNAIMSSIFGRDIYGSVLIVKNGPTNGLYSPKVLRSEVARTLWYYGVSGRDPKTLTVMGTSGDQRMASVFDDQWTYLEAAAVQGSVLGLDCRMIMATMSATQLFTIALESNYSLVNSYMEWLRVNAEDEERETDDGYPVPATVAESVAGSPSSMDRLPLVDQIGFAATCALSQSCFQENLDHRAAALLARFGLQLPTADRVTRFLERNSYKATHGPGPSLDVGGASRIVMVLAGHGQEIHVIESLTQNPLDSILQLPSSADFGAWSHSQIWHAYPSHVVSRDAIITEVHMPRTGGLQGQQLIWSYMMEMSTLESNTSTTQRGERRSRKGPMDHARAWVSRRSYGDWGNSASPLHANGRELNLTYSDDVWEVSMAGILAATEYPTEYDNYPEAFMSIDERRSLSVNMFPITTDSVVNRIKASFGAEQVYQGLLFPTGERRAIPVPVPIGRGGYMCWLNPRLSPTNILHEAITFSITTSTDGAERVRNVTVFYIDQRTPGHPQNSLVLELGAIWTGNILAVWADEPGSIRGDLDSGDKEPITDCIVGYIFFQQ